MDGSGNPSPWAVRDQQARLEREGVLLVSRAVKGWWFYIRPLNDWNTDYHGAVARMLRTPQVAAYYARARLPGYVPTPEDAELDRLMQLNPLIEGCLVGWKGVEGRDGLPYPFTPDNARALLQHFPNVLQEVQRFAGDASNFSVSLDELETAKGNS